MEADMEALGDLLKADLGAWGAVLIGVALIYMAVAYVLRLTRS